MTCAIDLALRSTLPARGELLPPSRDRSSLQRALGGESQGVVCRPVSTEGNERLSDASLSDHGESASHPDEPFSRRIRRFVAAVCDDDERTVDEMVVRLTQTHRSLAPLAFVVGGFRMLFHGLKLLFTNWRLMLVQIVPAMWIWWAMFDFKEHVFHGKSFHVLHGPVLIAIVLAIAAVTAASFFLNAVFGFAIVQPGAPKIRPAVAKAHSHLGVILGSGAVVGVLLGLSTIVFPRWGQQWFAISLSVVIGVMMVSYVAVPSRLIGVKPTPSRRDKLTASVLGGALGTVVCTPPYLVARIGVLMLGSSVLFIPGLIVLAVGATIQAAATGAVKTVKMTAKLVVPDSPKPGDPAAPASPPAPT
jgi:hypothetical protein